MEGSWRARLGGGGDPGGQSRRAGCRASLPRSSPLRPEPLSTPPPRPCGGALSLRDWGGGGRGGISKKAETRIRGESKNVVQDPDELHSPLPGAVRRGETLARALIRPLKVAPLFHFLCFCSDEPEGVGAWHSSRPWSPHMVLSGSLGRAGPWRLALAPQRPDFWARPRLPATKHAHTCSMPPGPRPGRHVPLSGVCLAGGGAGQRSRVPCLWFGGNEEPEVPHLRLCLSSSESASWGAAPLLLGMKWRRRPAEAAVRWVFVGGRVQRATRASPLRLSLLASAPFL